MQKEVSTKETHMHMHTHIYINTYIYLFTQKSINCKSNCCSGVEIDSKGIARGISVLTGIIELHNVLKHEDLAVCRWKHQILKGR